MVAARAQKQEELQGGGKSGSLKVSSLLLLLSYFLHFASRWRQKWELEGKLPSYISSSCCEEDKNDNNIIVSSLSFSIILQVLENYNE